MKAKLIITGSLAGLLLACNPSGQKQVNSTEVSQDVTALDQSENAEDQMITRKIRQAVVADKELSMSAANVQIITREGVVTLTGMVRNQAEKEKVERIADRLKGNNRLENKLQIGK
ncbi:MAG: BON domain-containing protein [Parachlamydia sp.]|nr:BON domain-containing protein [Parachlamydia sp.]